MFGIFAWIVGIATLPGILSATRTNMKDVNSQEVAAWWLFPLIALVILVGIWIIGNIFGYLVHCYSAGFAIGAVVAVPFSLWIPENTFLYFVSSLVTLPIALLAWRGQSFRMDEARRYLSNFF
jgi:hypothetical protein